ncbi:dTMP kinase [Marinilabiliaceae bacterium ANBcel2]|nr:dTMP kinase [Marinilabiliaceae bacterium ANBcel2]
MQGKIVVIEGLDGSGKTTQLNLLKKSIKEMGLKYRHIHFPRLNEGYYGELVAQFLRGEFGSLDMVHPKLVALLFANDRKEHIDIINKWLEQGYIIIADRYVSSNIAFQCAKCSNEKERKELKQWIYNFEYGYNMLPQPDISFFLDVPFSAIVESLSNERVGKDRDYLDGKNDIHEDSVELQKAVYNEYKEMTLLQNDFYSIDCSDDKGERLTPNVISEKMISILTRENII